MHLGGGYSHLEYWQPSSSLRTCPSMNQSRRQWCVALAVALRCMACSTLATRSRSQSQATCSQWSVMTAATSSAVEQAVATTVMKSVAEHDADAHVQQLRLLGLSGGGPSELVLRGSLRTLLFDSCCGGLGFRGALHRVACTAHYLACVRAPKPHRAVWP